MAIFLNENSRVIVQGMTGSEGSKHTRRMLASGTNIVGGVNARKAGTTVDFDGTELPVFGSVAEAMEQDRRRRVGAVRAAGVHQGRDHRGDRRRDRAGRGDHRGCPGARLRRSPGRTPSPTGNKTRIIGPNCPGIISPGKSNAGIIPANITGPGRVGLVSKSGTLTYQMMYELRDLGFSTAIGIGGDPIIGTTHIDALEAFEADDGDRRDRDDRRDRRRRRGTRRRVHRRQRDASRSSGTSPGSPPPRARPWATPAPSSPARPAPRRPRRKPSRRSASRSARPRPRPPGCCARSASAVGDPSRRTEKAGASDELGIQGG